MAQDKLSTMRRVFSLNTLGMLAIVLSFFAAATDLAIFFERPSRPAELDKSRIWSVVRDEESASVWIELGERTHVQIWQASAQQANLNPRLGEHSNGELRAVERNDPSLRQTLEARDPKQVPKIEIDRIVQALQALNESEKAISAGARPSRASMAQLAANQSKPTKVFLAWRDVLPWDQETPIRMIVGSGDPAVARQELARAKDYKTAEGEAKLGRRIRAELIGPDVDVEPTGQIERDVTELENVTLEWMVKPTRPGKTTLTAKVWNGIEVAPGDFVWVEHRPAYEKTVAVQISAVDWLTWQMKTFEGVQWLFAGLVAATGLLIANRRRLRLWWRLRHRKAKVEAPAAVPNTPSSQDAAPPT